jgi:pimeloyl-ACP methyl ester carboxylesterase
MPAGPAYGALIDALGPSVDARPKDLELYAGDRPPPEYSLGHEVAGIERAADEAGFDRFHLVGYSAGGASSIAFALEHPERLQSLALMEPAFAGWGRMGPDERAHFERFRDLANLDGRELMAAFRSLQLAPGTEPEPPAAGPPPPWMAKRPAGVLAVLEAFFASDEDVEGLGSFARPVWFAVGGRSHPDYYARMADRLATVVPDFTIERFPERHHFDPPHRIEPQRVAASLTALWDRAEGD